MNNNENNQVSFQDFAPIRCPICGSRNLAFTEEHRKSLGRIWLIILTGAYVALIILIIRQIIYNIELLNSLIPVTIVYTILIIIVQSIIWNTERKSHAKGICRDCGFIWLLD